MATLTNRRLSAMLLQNAVNTVYDAILPLYSLTAFWNVSGIDDDLPAEGEVKTVLESYSTMSLPGLNARTALQDVAASTEDFSGVFALPSTAFLVPFTFSGPVWAPSSTSQGFGVALSIQRLTVFVKQSGTTGPALSLDLQLDGVSILTAPITLAAGSGENVGLIIPPDQLTATAIPASSILSAHILSAPDDAEGVAVNVWAKAA